MQGKHKVQSTRALTRLATSVLAAHRLPSSAASTAVRVVQGALKLVADSGVSIDDNDGLVDAVDLATACVTCVIRCNFYSCSIFNVFQFSTRNNHVVLCSINILER